MPFFSPKGEPLQNPYQLLGLEHGSCTDDEIAKAFKRLMLQLHPDKQPAGQSPEEAEAVAQKLHEVMDAKSFLLDGEHLAAKREYDAKLARAKQPQPQAAMQFPLPSRKAPAASAAATAPASAAASNKNGAPDSPGAGRKSSHGVKKSSGGGIERSGDKHTSGAAKATSGSKTNRAASFSKKNVNVKQWGRPKARGGGGDNRRRSLSQRGGGGGGGGGQNSRSKSARRAPDGPANKAKAGGTAKGSINKSSSSKSMDNNNSSSSSNINSNNPTQNKTASSSTPSSDNNNGSTNNINPMKNKTHTRARGKAFNDSCGDCSTTDDCSSTTDDEGKRKHTYAGGASAFSSNNHRPVSSNRPSVPRNARNKVFPRPQNPSNVSSNNNPKRNNSCSEASGGVSGDVGPSHEKSRSDQGISGGSRPCDERNRSEQGILRGGNNKSTSTPDIDTSKRSFSSIPEETNTKPSPEQQQHPKSGYRPSDAKNKADFSSFFPAIDLLKKQYHCPLTGEVMREPMSDFEGNSYERGAVLKYLETHSTSPVTGNPLYPMHLTPNTALTEKIRYTLKLKTCLDSLQQKHIGNNPTVQHQLPPKHNKSRSNNESAYSSLREAVDVGFIKDLNSGSPSITISQLNDSGATSFSYLGLKFRLEVPVGGVADNVIVQTWFDHGKRAAGISGRIVQFNAALQKMGLDGKLTYRNMNGKNAFTLTKTMDPEKFSKISLRHSIEYFMEMSIKLHNAINTGDMKKVDKVRLVNSVACQ
eukprot:CAMPEP_0181123974 /NCGR_PEP_ID=MMETSP1071-20121207/26214_1 /TAXON_ID=35127 /ORGANISM="Thalassiosira sp., Strain NH16" /LENGTH=755 /DNA_ID=CAMNT_0023209209 /DNA_START=163 /DNA_END=2430 /DNA_ORIENTATION=-